MKRVPIGIENFKKMIDDNCYYVDKNGLINDVLNEEVILYTRPRRFGKTLNMSMLYYFFSIKQKDNAYLFRDLKIERNIEAKKHQNKYPIIFIILKDMKRNNFNDQTEKFAALISDIVDNNIELLESLV
ncbi:AAA family ATPase [Thomasclavelia ramosa]|uniref:AAA family ATPase n=1 Tax=Thomasclavelia ramosa TaxID=1547 RepID=UPI0032BFA58B